MPSLPKFIRAIIPWCLWLSSGTAFAEQSRNHGGVSAGMEIVAKQEVGLEADFIYNLNQEQDHPAGSPFKIFRFNFGRHFLETDDTGLDYYFESGFCYGYFFHGCLGLGYRQQGKTSNAIQTSLEFGTGFLFAIFGRHLMTVNSDSRNPSGAEREYGVKFKFPIYTF
jgi:hypothetical protein